jgi:hypothetical protein
MKIDSGVVFKEAFDAVDKNKETILLVSLLYSLITLIPSVLKCSQWVYLHGLPDIENLQNLNKVTSTPQELLLGFTLSIVGILLVNPFRIGFIRHCIRTSKTGVVDISNLIFTFKQGKDYYLRCCFSSIVVSLIISCWITVGVLIVVFTTTLLFIISHMIGLIAGGILGTIVLIFVINKLFNYLLVPFVLADDKNIKIMDAIKMSTNLIKNNQWSYFFLTCRITGLAMLAVLCGSIAVGGFFMLFQTLGLGTLGIILNAILGMIFLVGLLVLMYTIGVLSLSIFYLKSKENL